MEEGHVKLEPQAQELGTTKKKKNTITTKIGLDWAFGLINPCEKLEFHFLIIRSCSIIIIYINYM